MKAAVCFLLAIATYSAATFATPQILRVDGSLFESTGAPATSSKDIQIKAYDATSGGTLLWTSNVYTTSVAAGRFTINMDASSGSVPSLVTQIALRTSAQALYFQIEVDSGVDNGSMDSATVVLPRIRAKGAMFALSAAQADSVTGVTLNIAAIANVAPGTTGNVLTSTGSGWASSPSASGSVVPQYRQTIVTSAADGSGGASFIAVGTGLAVNISASATSPLTLSFSKGIDSTGMAAVLGAVTTNVTSAWAGLTANTTNYLYVERDSSTGALSYAATTSRPLEGYSPIATGTAVPTMTGATAPSGTASASSEFGGYYGWSAFNGTVASHTDTWLASDTSVPQWIRYDFGSGNSKIIAQYALVATCYGWGTDINPKTFKLQGSANGSSWTDLDSRSNITTWSLCERKTYTIASPASYRYYRLYISAYNGGTYLAVGEFELYEQNPNWFDLAKNTAYSWGGSSYTAVQRVFVGEAVTGGSSVSSVRSYGGTGACPSDMSAVMSGRREQSFCIERTERTVATFFNAHTTCNNEGRRLCGAAEWSRACSKGPSLSNITGNYEWVDDLSYVSNANVMGSASCVDVSWDAVTNTYGYRCCQSMTP